MTNISKNQPKRLKRSFIPNIATIFNMFLGFLAITLILNGEPIKAGWVMMVGVFFDVLDGKLARLMGLTSRFGTEFDSLADTVSFCAVPSVLVYSIYVDGLPIILGAAISFMPLLFGTIRLAKFNIDETQSVNFSGFPTPLIAIIFCFFPLYFSLNLNTWTTESSLIHFLFDAYTLSAIIAIFSICMLLPIPLMSLKIQKTNPRENQLKLGFLIISALSIPFLKVLSIPFILTLYLIVSIYHSIKKNKDEI